jgi:hypothetical protein
MAKTLSSLSSVMQHNYTVIIAISKTCMIVTSPGVFFPLHLAHSLNPR